MKKYRVFGIVMSSMLILSTMSSTIVAVAENTEDNMVDRFDGELENIKQMFNKLDTLSLDSSILSDEQINALKGFVNDTYSIELTVKENASYISYSEIDESFIKQLNNQEVLIFASNEDKDTRADISIAELFELTDLIVTEDEDEEANGKEANNEEVNNNEETTIEETGSSENKSNEKDLSLENEETENEEAEIEEKIPVASYTPKENTSDEDVSLSRSSEVEEILHGEVNVDSPTDLHVRTSSTRVATNGLYTVKSGDTFQAIANSFNLSNRQLVEWNGHVSNVNNLIIGTKLAVTRRGVEALLSNADKARLYRGGAEPVFTLPQEFIDEIATRAIKVSNQDGKEALWPSLMIAQAAHESNYGRSSLASPPYYNLSGIKGSHNGKSVLMWTWEVLGGVRVSVLASFRHYPSYDASLQSYADLMRNGLSWNRQYYSGTWRSKTNSVWDVLNNGGLKGYATDPNYYAAIKRIINQFDLTKYDTGNYYVRTGTFLGEAFTQKQVSRLANGNKSLSFRKVVENSKKPYSYRAIQSTKEFIGEAGAQKVINQLSSEKGWAASMIKTNGGTERHRVRSGYFNTLNRAELALKRFKDLSGYSASIEKGSDGKYRILTGFFNGSSSAQKGLNYMEQLGWGAKVIATGNFTPHYVVRTGTFNTPNHVNGAEDYFSSKGWGTKQILSTKKNYYYRIIVEDFVYEAQANTFVKNIKQKYNWGSTAFPVNK